MDRRHRTRYQHTQPRQGSPRTEAFKSTATPKNSGLHRGSGRCQHYQHDPVKRVSYTVPSRLIGEKLRLHIYHDRIEAYLGTTHALTLPRHFSPGKNHRGRCVDYRHVIGSLERKPQAFRYSQIRDDLLPAKLTGAYGNGLTGSWILAQPARRS